MCQAELQADKRGMAWPRLGPLYPGTDGRSQGGRRRPRVASDRVARSQKMSHGRQRALPARDGAGAWPGSQRTEPPFHCATGADRPEDPGCILGECRELRLLGLRPRVNPNLCPQSLAPESKPLEEGRPTRAPGKPSSVGSRTTEGGCGLAQWLRRGRSPRLASLLSQAD